MITTVVIDVLKRFNKRMFFFFGPPQLGRGGPSPAIDRDPVCPRCGYRESEHTIFRDAKKSFAQCPPD